MDETAALLIPAITAIVAAGINYLVARRARKAAPETPEAPAPSAPETPNPLFGAGPLTGRFEVTGAHNRITTRIN